MVDYLATIKTYTIYFVVSALKVIGMPINIYVIARALNCMIMLLTACQIK